ncbi:hypothetical protein ACQCSX_20660 [Pseudarthrobacter sp. P1]|uniref:hypothetical protein n=1 Tax=Pseudarthrobacter sp. P1 TaxID=3418418 RepID=UPI003CF49A76
MSAFAVASLLAVGGASAHAAMDHPAPAPAVSETGSGDPSHPECYDAAKLNDPSDFCYQTMGPWNSTLATFDEVRQHVSIETMVEMGRTTAQIQRYYPDYTPTAK